MPENSIVSIPDNLLDAASVYSIARARGLACQTCKAPINDGAGAVSQTPEGTFKIHHKAPQCADFEHIWRVALERLSTVTKAMRATRRFRDGATLTTLFRCLGYSASDCLMALDWGFRGSIRWLSDPWNRMFWVYAAQQKDPIGCGKLDCSQCYPPRAIRGLVCN